jgi:hypothetical protein
MELPGTTSHWWVFSDDRDLGVHGHGKGRLSETRRPDFISTVRPGCSVSEYLLGNPILFLLMEL